MIIYTIIKKFDFNPKKAQDLNIGNIIELKYDSRVPQILSYYRHLMTQKKIKRSYL